MNKKSLLVGLLPTVLAIAPAVAEVNQPQEIIDRPRTTPANQLTAGGDIAINFSPDPDGDGPAESSTTAGLLLGINYGVTPELEVDGAYAFALKELEAKGAIGVGAAYALLPTGNLTVAIDAAFGYDLLAKGVTPLDVGARVQFKLNPQLAIYTPGRQLSIALEEVTTGTPPATTSSRPVTLGLPVGVAYQVNPQLYTFLQTEVGTVSLNDVGNSVWFAADYIPLYAGAFFSPSNTADIGAAISWGDIEHEADVVSLVLAARLHL